MTLNKFFSLAVGCLRSIGVPLLAAFALAAGPGFAVAQPNQSAVPGEGEFRACRGIADNNARLACYDLLLPPEQHIDNDAGSPAESQAPVASTQAADNAPPSTTAVPLAPTTPAPAEAAVTTAAAANVTPENFGAAPPRLETNAEGDAELVATVTGIEELTKGKLRISLSNGQLWLQSISKSFFLRERDTVRISKSPWGGTFRLHKDGKPGYIQVERLR